MGALEFQTRSSSMTTLAHRNRLECPASIIPAGERQVRGLDAREDIG